MNEVHVMGYDRGAVWDEAVPVYVTRFGDKREPGICHIKSAVATRMKRGEYIGPFERLHERLVS